METLSPWRPSFESSVQVARLLGRGSFGEVLLAKVAGESALSSQLVALKRAPLVGQLSEVASDKAQEEAELLMTLSQECPQILRCFDFRWLPGTWPVLELMLEFAPLGDLSRRIRQQKAWCQENLVEVVGMPETELVSYGSDIAAGLSYLHSLRPKILHRDVKPANILLFASQEALFPRAKLADFGIAKILELETSLAGAATVIGTPHYFAPELCRGEQYDERADSWALGCILYEMMCLHRPFHEAEGNLAVLAVRISEGKYDRAALEKQAEHYNGVLVLALAGLLCAIQEQRTRACDVLESLKRVKARFDVGSVPASTTWWQSQQEEATLGRSQEMESSEVEGLPASSASDSWKGATLAQLEGLLSQVSGRWMQPEEAVTLGATQLGQAPTPGASPSGSPASDATAAHAANTSPGASRPEASRTAFVSPEAKPRVWGSEPGTEYLGEGESLRRSQHTTPSSVWSPCRTAWGEAPTFGSPTVELQPETPEGARPGSSLRRTGTRIFCRPVRSEVRVDETRRGRGRTWHCSEISEDEVIFCFAPTEASEAHGLGTTCPPPSPRADVSGWQEVEVPDAPRCTEEEAAWQLGIFALTSLT